MRRFISLILVAILLIAFSGCIWVRGGRHGVHNRAGYHEQYREGSDWDRHDNGQDFDDHQ